MSLQDLTNASLPLHKNQDLKTYIPDLKNVVCYCQGDPELINILTAAISEVLYENEDLLRREKALISTLTQYLTEENELDLKVKDLKSVILKY